MELTGKVAVVTGAGVGIGRGCAVALAKEGAKVVLNDVSEERLNDAVSEIESFGGVCDRIKADLFDTDEVQKIAEHATATFGGIDVLVTGPASSTASAFLDEELDATLKAISDDFISHMRLAQRAARDMIARKSGGKIIFISSVYGTLNRKKQLGYDVSKAGLNHATRKLARELGQYNILVNAIAPGFTDTPGEREYADDAKVEEIVSGLLLGRAGTPRDIGEAAVYLARADYVTGTVLTVDGGMSLVDYTYDKNERR